VCAAIPEPTTTAERKTHPRNSRMSFLQRATSPAPALACRGHEGSAAHTRALELGSFLNCSGVDSGVFLGATRSALRR
jgi:hypothetical protein